MGDPDEPPSEHDVLPVVMAPEEVQLWDRLRTGDDPVAKNELFKRHAGLVRPIAARLFRSAGYGYVEFREIVQLGVVGLLEALSRFDIREGSSFAAFASHRIRGSILNGLQRHSEYHSQNVFRRSLRQDRVRSLAPEEPRGTTNEVFLQMVELSVGLAIGYMLEGTAMYAPPDAEAPEQENSGELSVASAQLRHLVIRLPDTERRVVEYHYLQGMQFTDIANLLGVSRARISQLHSSALKKLRELYRNIGSLDVQL